jgi:hypothetical protein
MTTLHRILPIAMLAMLPAAMARADLVVVASAHSGVDKLSHGEAINIFLGRYRQLPSGIPALPVDLPDASQEKARFYRLLVNKDLAEINAYWTRLVFSGKTSPPRQMKSSGQALDWLAANEGGLAYMDRSQVDARARIVLELER